MHKELWRRIAERCAELNANRSDFIRKAVETALKEPEKQTHAK
jgi:metal-responsive CopG/Arc/MetJ family transcriptional regulator